MKQFSPSKWKKWCCASKGIIKHEAALLNLSFADLGKLLNTRYTEVTQKDVDLIMTCLWVIMKECILHETSASHLRGIKAMRRILVSYTNGQIPR